MIAKEAEDSVTKTSPKKLKLCWGEYEWDNAGGIKINDVTTMFYLLFKIINPDTRIGVSNLKYDIWESNPS